MPITDLKDLLDGDRLYEGQLLYPKDADIWAADNEDTQILVFGRLLVWGAAEEGVLLPVDANSIPAGIAMATDTIEKRSGYSLNADNDMGYPLKHRVSLVRRGVIGVKVVQAVTKNSSPFWIHNPQTGQRKGHFRADLDTNRAVLLPNARFIRAGAINTVVPLEFDFTGVK
jgi:hypothetical protein